MLNLLKSRASVFIVLCFFIQISSYNTSNAACPPWTTTVSTVTFNYNGCTIIQEVCSFVDYTTLQIDVQYGTMTVLGGCSIQNLMNDQNFLTLRDNESLLYLLLIEDRYHLTLCSQQPQLTYVHFTTIVCNKIINTGWNNSQTLVQCENNAKCIKTYRVCRQSYTSPLSITNLSMTLLNTELDGTPDCDTQYPNMIDPNIEPYYDLDDDFETYCFAWHCW